MSEQTCCLPHGLCANVDCTVEESKDGLTLHMRGKTPEQSEALKTLYASWTTLRGASSSETCCCC